ncbi:glycerate kinase, partial [Saccharothrix hoggarensis]
MRVLIAPDSFKGTIGAAEAAERLADGWRAVRPDDDVRRLGLADGGEAAAAVLAPTDPGAVTLSARVPDPVGRVRDARWVLLGDGTAVVELAEASGLPLLEEPDPLGAHTAGFGALVRAALAHPGTRRIAATLGGSATTDGGSGALVALGAVFRDDAGVPLPLGGGALTALAEADLTGLAAPPPGGVVCLTDVDTPLLGPTGAAHRFGPQKGADPAAVAVLDAGLT